MRELLFDMELEDRREAARLIPQYLLIQHFVHNMTTQERSDLLKKATEELALMTRLANEDFERELSITEIDDAAKKRFQVIDAKRRSTMTKLRKLRMFSHWFDANK
jgi:hypothetical protein